MIKLPDVKPRLDNRSLQTGIYSSTHGSKATTKTSLGYRVGDMLDVNCTSPRSKPPATLKWYINNEVKKITVFG